MKKIFIILLLFNFTLHAQTPSTSTIARPFTVKSFITYLKPDIEFHSDLSNVPIQSLIPLPVIVLAGQSNMEGGDTTTAGTPFTGIIRNALVYFKPTGTVKMMQYGIDNNWRNSKKYYGAECAIAYYMTQAGNKIGIIKYAYGGSQLVDTKYRVQGHWQIDADSTHGRNNYDTLIHQYVLPGLQAFKNAGYNPYILSFVWCQGEADATDSIAASRYQTELTRLFTAFAMDTGLDSCTFIITKTHPIASYKYMNTVRQGQENVAASYPAYLINGDSWPLIYDHIHWTRYSQGSHGKSIADILIPLIK